MDAHAILVVDDEPASVRAIRRTLGGDYQVLTAAGGDEALHILEAQPVSVLLTDNRMPGMSGAELLARCRSGFPDVVRIVLTGYADVDTVVDAINQGEVYHYLTKPWAPRDLLLAIRRAIGHFEARRERERLVQALHAACTRAQRAAEDKARLLATAAHELGTPLHLVMNAVHLLAGVPELRGNRWLGVAERGVDWLARSLAQMHTAVQLREQRIRLACEPTDVASGLAAVLADLRRALGGRQLAVGLEAEPGLTAWGDPQWLRSVWIALLSNAVRFTADGGAVRVAGRRARCGVAVDVTDTGIGMAPEQLAVAFEPFSAAAGDLLLHSSGRFDFGARGMGLGLFIARAIVERHGGTIHIESACGHGTRVAVWLPADGGECAAALGGSAGGEGPVAGAGDVPGESRMRGPELA